MSGAPEEVPPVPGVPPTGQSERPKKAPPLLPAIPDPPGGIGAGKLAELVEDEGVVRAGSIPFLHYCIKSLEQDREQKKEVLKRLNGQLETARAEAADSAQRLAVLNAEMKGLKVVNLQSKTMLSIGMLLLGAALGYFPQYQNWALAAGIVGALLVILGVLLPSHGASS